MQTLAFWLYGKLKEKKMARKRYKNEDLIQNILEEFLDCVNAENIKETHEPFAMRNLIEEYAHIIAHFVGMEEINEENAENE